ncbi:hypothetical protein A2U01_0108634, partial [Trifolium medium]|nr:hypothetical protein [Trifolium medium]
MACINTFNALAVNGKRKGESGSPCLNPLSKENSSVELPLTRTEVAAVQTHSFIHFLHRTGKAILP